MYGTEERIKLDDRDDALFYEQSRMAPHVDGVFQQQLAGAVIRPCYGVLSEAPHQALAHAVPCGPEGAL